MAGTEMSDEGSRDGHQEGKLPATFGAAFALIFVLLMVGTFSLLVIEVVAGSVGSGGVFYSVILASVGAIGFLFYRAARPSLTQFDRSLLFIDGISSAARQRVFMLFVLTAIILLLQVFLVLYSVSGTERTINFVDVIVASAVLLFMIKTLLILGWTRKLYVLHGDRYRFSTIFVMMFGARSQVDMDESLWGDFRKIQNYNFVGNVLIVLGVVSVGFVAVLTK